MRNMLNFFKLQARKRHLLTISNIENLIEERNYDSVFYILTMIEKHKNKSDILLKLYFSEIKNKKLNLLERITEICPLYCVEKAIKMLSPLSGERQTKLMGLAIEQESFEKVNLLINCGFDIKKDHTKSMDFIYMLPIHKAIMIACFYKTESPNERTKIIDLLLEKGAKINDIDSKRRNTYELASLNISPFLFKYLIDNGLDIEKKSEFNIDYIHMSLLALYNSRNHYQKEHFAECVHNIEINLQYLKSIGKPVNIQNLSMTFDLVIRLKIEKITAIFLEEYWDIMDKDECFWIAVDNVDLDLIKKIYPFISAENKFLKDKIIEKIILSHTNKESYAVVIEAVMSLCNIKINPQYKNEKGDTLFHLLLEKSYDLYFKEVFDILIFQGYDYDAANEKGIKAIDLAEDERVKTLFDQEYAKKEKIFLGTFIDGAKQVSEKKRL